MEKGKVLILYNDIKNYRVETWNIVAEQYDIDVAYPLNDESTTVCNFGKIHFKAKKLGPFFIVPNEIKSRYNNYDVIIYMPNFRYPSYCILPFKRRKYKVIPWGIGFRVSYTRPYDVNRKHTIWDSLYAKVLNHSDAIIMYMEKAKEFWSPKELNFEKIFIAPNTVRVKDIPMNPSNRTDFLFVGTLYAGKGLDKLISSYAKVKETVGVNNKLHIVGKGDRREYLEEMVKELNLTDEVLFHGAIYDEEVLSQLFAKSVLCISPTQAGLTAPKSLGYGTPFVCRKDAITGGEMYHVTNGVNGVFYDNDDDLYDIMKDAIVNPEKYQKMCVAAKEYYVNHATNRHMAQGVIDAIDYALKH